MKTSYKYRITVDAALQGQPVGEAVSFDVGSHDDLIDIMRRVRSLDDFEPAEANALVLGLKLFSGVMLARRGDPLFAAIQPEVRAFTGNLKARVFAAQQAKEVP